MNNNNFRYFYHDCCAECRFYDYFNEKCLKKSNDERDIVSEHNSICDLFKRED